MILPVNGGLFLDECVNRVRTLFQTKHSRTFQGLSRAKFGNFKDLFSTSKNLPMEIVWQYNSCSFSTTYMRKNNAKALVTILDPTARRVCMAWLEYLIISTEVFQRSKMRVRKNTRTFKALKMYSQNSRVLKGFQNAYETCVKGAMQTGLCCTCDVKCTWWAHQEPYEFSSSSPCHMWLQCNTCAETKRKKKIIVEVFICVQTLFPFYYLQFNNTPTEIKQSDRLIIDSLQN